MPFGLSSWLSMSSSTATRCTQSTAAWYPDNCTRLADSLQQTVYASKFPTLVGQFTQQSPCSILHWQIEIFNLNISICQCSLKLFYDTMSQYPVYYTIKFDADIFIQSGVIDIFLKFKMPAAAILDCQVVWIWPFRRVDSVVFELCTKFGSNICYSHWDRRTYPSDLHLMTSRELTSGFDFLSSGHLRMTVMHLPIKFGADIFIQSGVIDSCPKLKMAAAAFLDLLGRAMGPPTKAYSWCILPVKISWWSAK